MPVWNEGYTSEINYTSEYYSELSPGRIKLALLSKGIDHSVPDNPTYLELGFGQGLSLNINAATNAGSFFGTDFNPGQVANARELAQAMGKPLTLLEDSFEQLAARDDLPQFDIIALHGIWSWISETSRDAIIDILLNKLKPGGVAYVSYNVTPGWSPAVPLRTLLVEYCNREAAGVLIDKVDQSINFVDKVVSANASYFEQHPGLKMRLERMKQHDRNYLAHEYFNAHWEPMPFCEVADRLSAAKLSFAASGNILDNVPSISVPENARELLAAIRDPVLRETTKDYFLYQQFRRDLYVKGPRPIAPYDFGKRAEKMSFVLVGDPAKVPANINSSVGTVNLHPPAYTAVVDALAKSGNATASVADLVTACSPELTLSTVWEVLVVLTGINYVAPLSQSTTNEADKKAAAGLNDELLRRAEAGSGVNFLASPNLGSAVAIGRVDQLFTRAVRLGEVDPVAHVWRLLSAQGQHLIVEGQMLKSETENISHLQALYEDFRSTRAPLLERVGIL